MIGSSKSNREKLQNAFEHKEKKPGLSTNRPSNNWAVCLLPDLIRRVLSSGPHIRDYQQPKRAHPTLQNQF